MSTPENETEEQPAIEAAPPERPAVPGLIVSWMRDTPMCVVHELGKKAVVVGRSSTADIRIDDGAMSSRHVEIASRDSQWSVRDLDSKHGTHVDGVRLQGPHKGAARSLHVGTTIIRLVADIGDIAERRVVVEDGYVLGPAQQRAYAIAERVAQAGCDLLILGETGTGKERLAAAFHKAGPRARGAFTEVNCASLDKGVADSHLFGSVKGAFSGAENREGHFSAANKGTLYLDEVRELELEVQAKLLRAVELKQIQAVGSSVIKKLDLAIVAATQPRILDDVEEGRFRSDLFARLSSREVRIPRLEERVEEIPFLIHEYLKGFEIAPSAVEACMLSEWDRNVRGLHKALGDARVRVEVAKRAGIGAHDLTAFLRRLPAQVAMDATTLAKTADDAKLAVIRAALRKAGSIAGAARLLEVRRGTVHDAIKKHGIVWRTDPERS